MFSDPQKNIDSFGLLPGMKVADMGAGSGFYSVAAAQVVGDTGKVYAVDIQKELLAKIKNEASHRHIFNIEVVWGDIEKQGGTKLRNELVDAVVVANVLFQIHDKESFVKEVKRILKHKSRVLVVDWTDSFGGLGPMPHDIFTEQNAKELFERHAFSYEGKISAGAHHYGLIFKKS